MDFDFEIEINETIYNVYVIGYTRSRPAPACSNPSDPRYSDPGDPPDIEEIQIKDENDVDIVIDEETFDKIINRVYEIGESS